jgi:sacsin
MSDFGVNVGGSVDDETERISLVHANVPTSTSEILGVPTLMSRMLAAEQALDFGFGQTDSLTGRLKALLDDYSDGLSIPKELIQNADDAGATEVRLIDLQNELLF